MNIEEGRRRKKLRKNEGEYKVLNKSLFEGFIYLKSDMKNILEKFN